MDGPVDPSARAHQAVASGPALPVELPVPGRREPARRAESIGRRGSRDRGRPPPPDRRRRTTPTSSGWSSPTSRDSTSTFFQRLSVEPGSISAVALEDGFAPHPEDERHGRPHVARAVAPTTPRREGAEMSPVELALSSGSPPAPSASPGSAPSTCKARSRGCTRSSWRSSRSSCSRRRSWTSWSGWARRPARDPRSRTWSSRNRSSRSGASASCRSAMPRTDLLLLELEEPRPRFRGRGRDAGRSVRRGGAGARDHPAAATREQMLALSRHAVAVAARGRPRCPFCDNPMDPRATHARR